VNDLAELSLGSSPGEDAYSAIRQAILDGTLRPGERIVEQQLAERMNVSRTPVREALFKLERENLVARMGRGLSVRTYSAEEVRDNYDLRAVLEGYAARRAAERPYDSQITVLEQLEQRLEAAGEGEDFDPRACARLNQQFHTVLVRMPGSPSLERCFAQAIQLPLLYKAHLWYGEDDRARSASDHRSLIELLRGHEPEKAEELWRRHIEYGRDVLVARLAADEADSRS
jgi:DNA-binding GntR family transcriptional regulator